MGGEGKKVAQRLLSELGYSMEMKAHLKYVGSGISNMWEVGINTQMSGICAPAHTHTHTHTHTYTHTHTHTHMHTHTIYIYIPNTDTHTHTDYTCIDLKNLYVFTSILL